MAGWAGAVPAVLCCFKRYLRIQDQREFQRNRKWPVARAVPHALPVQWASGGSDQTPVLDMDETDMHSWFDKQKDHYTGTIVGYAERNGKRHYFEA